MLNHAYSTAPPLRMNKKPLGLGLSGNSFFSFINYSFAVRWSRQCHYGLWTNGLVRIILLETYFNITVAMKPPADLEDIMVLEVTIMGAA